MKQERFHIGDEVRWEGGPNEFRDNRHGMITELCGNYAKVQRRYSSHIAKVPISILTKE